MNCDNLKTTSLNECNLVPYDNGIYGVYLKGHILEESITKRSHTTNFEKNILYSFKENVHNKIDTAIYGGLLLTHYGHFIFESLSRLWYSRLDKSTPILFCSKQKVIKKFQQDIFNFLGIKNPIILVKEPIGVDNLIIPEPGSRIRDYLSEQHMEFLSCYPYNVDSNKKVWLSRSNLVRFIHQVDNEKELESKLEEKGWEIIHPQEYSIADQLEILANSSRIAGFVGSAFHTLLFFKEFTGQVTLFLRNPHKDFGPRIKINETYETIAKAKGINQSVIKPSLEFKTQKQSSIIDLSTILKELS